MQTTLQNSCFVNIPTLITFLNTVCTLPFYLFYIISIWSSYCCAYCTMLVYFYLILYLLFYFVVTHLFYCLLIDSRQPKPYRKLTTFLATTSGARSLHYAHLLSPARNHGMFVMFVVQNCTCTYCQIPCISTDWDQLGYMEQIHENKVSCSCKFAGTHNLQAGTQQC